MGRIRLAERDKRDVYLRRLETAAVDEYGEPARVWGEPILIRCVVQPARSALDLKVYGEKVNRMQRLFYDGGEEVREGDGLCIGVAGEMEPDYRVVSVSRWGQLEMVAEGREG